VGSEQEINQGQNARFVSGGRRLKFCRRYCDDVDRVDRCSQDDAGVRLQIGRNGVLPVMFELGPLADKTFR